MIEKRTVEVTRKRMLKPARFEDIDTGDRRERMVIKSDGERVVEQVPITQRVHYEPVFEDTIELKEVYVVKTKTKPNGRYNRAKSGLLLQSVEEEHHFASQEDAERFLNDTAKKRTIRG